MEIFNWFILATSIVALLSCNTNYAPTIEDAPLFDSPTRGETTQNDSSEGGGLGTTITPRDTISEDIVVTENEVKNDSVPSDSITKIN